MTTKIPTTIVTGFLGAGKTSLVRHLLANTGGKRIALIINEFGDLGVDRELLSGCGDKNCQAADMIELSNGCICCTVADEFIPTITDLLSRPERPDHIIIETSGLALPQPLVRAFNWPEIKAAVTVDGVIALVDAVALAEGRFASDEAAIDRERAADQMLDHDTPLGELFEDQLTAADLVILNKIDLISTDQASAVEKQLRDAMRPGTGLIKASHGAVDIGALFGLEFGSENHMDDRPTHHERDHGDAPHEHDEFDSTVIDLPEFDGRKILVARIEAVIRAHDILRLKGFAALKGAGARLAVQAVGPRVTTYFDRPFAPGEARETRLVAIGVSPLAKDAIALALAATS